VRSAFARRWLSDFSGDDDYWNNPAKTVKTDRDRRKIPP
jgi:hypothetical protein